MNPDDGTAIENTTDDVRAAITSLESAQPSAEASAPAPAQAPASAPAAAPATDDGQTRDAHGRFVAKEAAAPAAAPATSAQPPAQAPAQATAPPAPTDEEKGVVTLDPNKPPQAWTPAMREKWGTLPEDVRNEVIRREQDMAAGVQRLQQSYEPLRQIGGALQTYEPYFAHIQKPPVEYLNELIPIEQTLALGNPAQKLDMLLNVADRYGVPLRNVLDQAMGGQLKQTLDESHQKFGTPTPLPPQVQQELSQLRGMMENMQNTAAKNELDTFMADTVNHPFFHDVRDVMATLLENGACTTYQEAYDIAVWRDPEMRQRAMAAVNGQQQQAGIQQRQQAASVAVPPSGASLVQPSKPGESTGDVYDDVARAWNAVASGNRA